MWRYLQVATGSTERLPWVLHMSKSVPGAENALLRACCTPTNDNTAVLAIGSAIIACVVVVGTSRGETSLIQFFSSRNSVSPWHQHIDVYRDAGERVYFSLTFQKRDIRAGGAF